jgi:tetratricopeptide (TPR) repeat protein
MVIAVVRRRQGEPAEAERLLARVIEVARAADNRRYLAEAWLHRSRAYRDLGRADDARRAAAEALALGLDELAAPERAAPPPLTNPFANGHPPEPAELVRHAEAALARLLAANYVK